MRFDNLVLLPRRSLLAVLVGAVVSVLLATALPTAVAWDTTPQKKAAVKHAPTSPLGLSLEDTRTRLPDAGGDAPALLVTRAVGPAADAGLQAGDLVIELNGKPIVGVTDFWEQHAAANGYLRLRVLRDGKTLLIRLNGSPIR